MKLTPDHRAMCVPCCRHPPELIIIFQFKATTLLLVVNQSKLSHFCLSDDQRWWRF